MKLCSKCKSPKAATMEFFCKDKKSKDGLQSVCKCCKSKQLKLYYKRNPNKKHTISKEYQLAQYYKNRVHCNVARLIRRGLDGFTKSKPTFDLLGYTVEDLKLHLETKFDENMTWENYGEWHIDHKIPRSKLPYDSPLHPNFKLCWSLENLQPLWAVDNLSKGNR